MLKLFYLQLANVNLTIYSKTLEVAFVFVGKAAVSPANQDLY